MVVRSSSFITIGEWNGFFCIQNEWCDVGDFNGDGRDDIVAFAKWTNEPALAEGPGVNGSCPDAAELRLPRRPADDTPPVLGHHAPPMSRAAPAALLLLLCSACATVPPCG